MGLLKRFFSVLTICLLTLPIGTSFADSLRSGEPGFGYEWIEKNGFPIMALVDVFDDKSPYEAYRAANFTSAMINHESGARQYQRQYIPTIDACEANGLTYHLTTPTEQNGRILQSMSRLRTDMDAGGFANDNHAGFYVVDEPHRKRMTDVAELVDRVRESYGSDMAPWKSKPIWATAMEENGCTYFLYYNYSCDDVRACSLPNPPRRCRDNPIPTPPPPAGYDYDAYLRDLIGVMKLDILAYDNYPFKKFAPGADDAETNNFYRNMMRVRKAAKDANLPYWVWMQAHEHPALRVPSESDTRLHAFVHLAVGYSGFIYFKFHTGYIWNYGHYYRPPDVVEAGDSRPGEGYDVVSQLNVELTNLGKVLRYLRHVDSRVASSAAAAGTWPDDAGIAVYNKKDALYAENGIGDITVRPRGDRRGKAHVMISVFRDPDLPESDQNFYFMIVNLRHHGRASAEDMRQEIRVDFSGSITTAEGEEKPISDLLYVDNQTGETKRLDLTARSNNLHQLRMTLETGGRLFKFDNGYGRFPRSDDR